MADMNKIVDDIMLEAENEAKDIISKAEKDAAEIIRNAENECSLIEQTESRRREEEIKRVKRRGEAARASKRRAVLLEEKQKLLNNAVKKAYDEILNMPSAEYEKILLELLNSRMRSGKCTLYFPKGFVAPSEEFSDKLRQMASDKGCNYAISHERNIDSGFVAVYGGIEENCTLKSLFEEHGDEILSLAASEILGTEENV